MPFRLRPRRGGTCSPRPNGSWASGLTGLKFLFQQLLPVDRGVEAVAGDQLLVRPALRDSSLLQHEDLVGLAHSRDAVRDDDRGAPAHDAAQARENLLLG